MIRKSILELIDLAEKYNEEGIAWHHHFFTPKCFFNKSRKFSIVLENEATGEVFMSEFEEKPVNELKRLESLFFKR